MSRDIIAVIDLKIAEIQNLIAALEAAKAALVGPSTNRVAKVRRRKGLRQGHALTPAGRRAISRAMKARWAEVKRAAKEA